MSIPYLITLKYQGAVPGRTLKRSDLNRLLKATWLTQGKFWHEHLRKKHFTSEGAREYGYRKRRPLYTQRKRRQKGHTLPLVFSGDLKRGSRQANITSTSKGVRVALPGARGANRPGRERGDGLPRIDKAAELRAVSPREQTRIARNLENGLAERLKNYPASQTKKL